MEKTQRAMWRVEGKLRENFFFPYKKGPRAVPTVGRRIDRRGVQTAIWREGEEGRANYFGILILFGRAYLRKFVSGKKSAIRSRARARIRVPFAIGRWCLSPVVTGRFLARKHSYGERKEDGARAADTKGTSVVGDECRKQPMRSNAMFRFERTRRFTDENSISYSTIDRLSDAVSLPFPHENPGELIFDKGPLNFFVKQNLTRCRRALGNPGKKYLRGGGEAYIYVDRVGGLVRHQVAKSIRESPTGSFSRRSRGEQ